MAHSTIKGATIPDAGDDLLASWDAYDRTVGTIMPTDSIAAARTTLASAEAAGTGPTAAHPWYFDMNNVIYRATGAKSSGGVFTLAPVNEVETYSASASAFTQAGNLITLNNEQWEVTHLTVPQKPYPRMFFAMGVADGYLSSGTGINLTVLIRNVPGQLARFPNTGVEQSTAVMNLGLVPAGTDANVFLAVNGTGTFFITPNSLANRLNAIAFPVTAA